MPPRAALHNYRFYLRTPEEGKFQEVSEGFYLVVAVVEGCDLPTNPPPPPPPTTTTTTTTTITRTTTTTTTTKQQPQQQQKQQQQQLLLLLLLLLLLPSTAPCTTAYITITTRT